MPGVSLQWSPEVYLGDIDALDPRVDAPVHASMEPRVLSRGYAIGTLACARQPKMLQWSPEFYLGDISIPGRPALRGRCFNGAPSFISGISARRWAPSSALSVLQWSPEFYLGDMSPAVPSNTPGLRFNGAPSFISGISRCGLRRSGPLPASMEPRVLSRGYPSCASPGRSSKRCFNGAPSFISGISQCPANGDRYRLKLQWSPEFYLGDILVGGPGDEGPVVASMEPRVLSRGYRRDPAGSHQEPAHSASMEPRVLSRGYGRAMRSTRRSSPASMEPRVLSRGYARRQQPNVFKDLHPRFRAARAGRYPYRDEPSSSRGNRAKSRPIPAASDPRHFHATGSLATPAVRPRRNLRSGCQRPR